MLSGWDEEGVERNSSIDLVFGVNGSSDYHDGWLDEFRLMKGDDNDWNDNTSITAPTASVPASAEVYVKDELGNATKLSSHRGGEWEYLSKSPTGEITRINMEEVVRDLGQLTGKDYIKHE
jgi:hypothetical protein